MAKTCPSCGYQTDDNQSLYCDKCGFPFPRTLPQKKAVAAPLVHRPVPAAVIPPRLKNHGLSGFLSFDTLIIGDYLRLIYIIGAVVIILVSLMGIVGMFSTPAAGGANLSITNTTALAENPAGSPLFWIGFLVAGSILWRMFCELFVVLSRRNGVADYGDEPAYETADDGGEETSAGSSEWSGQMVECPKCHRIVPAGDLRECEHCGVQGCSSCIRMMGLLKKTMTCRECFETK